MTLHRLAALLIAGLVAFAPSALANCILANNVVEATPDAHFADNGDGTVTHTTTGLTWKRCTEGQTWTGTTCAGDSAIDNWGNALTRARNSTFAGYGDWRLPSRRELESILESACAAAPSINSNVFPLAPASATWTGTTYASVAAYAWYVHFNDGDVSNVNKSAGFYVRLVRGGQSLSAFDLSSAGNGLTLSSVNGGANPQVNTGFNVVVSSTANVAMDTPVTLLKNSGAGTLGGTTTCTLATGTNTCTVSGATWDTGETGVHLVANAEGFVSGRSAAFTVAKQDQTITFNALANKTYGDADFAVSASASSGLTVGFTSQTASVCSVTGGSVHLAAAGECTIRASQAGNGAYYAALDVERSFTVNKATPTITWATPAAITYGTALSATQLNASASFGGNPLAGGFTYTPTSGTVPGAGSQPLNASFTPSDSTNFTGANASVSLTVNPAGQTISFSPPTSGVTGQVIGLSATGGGSGNAVVLAVESGPCGLSGANLTLTGVGTCRVSANQAGNANYAAAPTVSADIAVSKANTTTTLTGHGTSPSNVGQGISVTYTVTANSPGGGTPTGNVTVSDGTDSCTGTVAAGGCTLTPSTPGAKTLTATYASDANYNGSASTGVSHGVNAIGTTTTVTVVNPAGQSNTGKSATSVYGQAVTVTVEVVAASGSHHPPGTAQVTVGGKTCGFALADLTGGKSGGQCSLNASSGYPDAGTGQAVSASYTPAPDNANFAASSSSGAGNGSLTVTEADTTTTLSTNPVNSTAGGNVDLVATISATSPSSATPAGTVAFSAGGMAIPGCGALTVGNDGKATCSTSFATHGAKTIRAVFTGNANFNGSDSGDQTHTVNAASSTTAITGITPAGPYTYGAGLTVNVSVTGTVGTPSGTVRIAAGTASCDASLAAGTGGCALVPPAGSPTTINATYNGDGIYGGSTHSQTANIAQAPPTVSLTPSPSPSTVGDGVTLNVTVARSNANSQHPTGTVVVKNGATTLCTTGNLVNGQASCAHSFAATGTYSLTAEYAGDTNYQGNTGTASHDVQVASTSTVLTTISPNPATYGQTVTVNVTVTGNATLGAPTGTVTLSGAGSCTATLSASSATVATGSCQPTGLNAGVGQTLTATYSGDGLYGGSTANGSLTVNKATATVNLGNLGPHTYDGSQKSATCSTTPSVSHDITYQDVGSGTGRINAGSYGATCTVTDPNYTGSASGTLTIGQATPTITWATPAAITYGTALSATQLNASASFGGNPLAGGFAYTPASGTLLGAGSQPLNASFTPSDSTNFTGANASVSLTVNQSGQTISFSPPTSGVTGQVIGLSATGGGSGNAVALSVESGPCGLSGANLTLTGVGTCRVSANQAGNTNYAVAPTVSADIAVNKANTATTLTGHGTGPSTVGQGINVTYTVSVTSPGGGTPTGNVTVSDGNDSCTGTVAAGGCTLTPTTVGAKTLTASYAGDSNYNGSSSAGVSHTVNAMATTTTVTMVNPAGQSNTGKTATSVYGQAVTVTVEVAAASGANYPPGTARVSVNGKTCDIALSDLTGGKSGGQCTLNASSGYPDAGTGQAVTASYTPAPDNANFAPSSSSGAGNGSLTVAESDTTTTLSTSPVNSTAGGNVDLIATIASVAPGTATPVGTVAFSAGGTLIAACSGANAKTVDGSGKATCTTSFSTWGDKTLRAAFTGNANFNDSDSGNQTHTVNSAASTTHIDSLNPASGPYTYGNALTVTVSVSGSVGQPTGDVTLGAGTASCTATLASGTGSCALYPPAGSPTTVSATYNGDGIYGGSSANTPITVTKATPTVSLTPTPSPSTVGDGVTFNVTVARPNTNSVHPTGTVTVKNGASTMCTTGNLVNGQASCAQSFAATGHYSLTADYAGDANYQGNTGSASHNVQVASTVTAISSLTPNPATYGQAVTVNVTVTGNATLGAPTGTVTLSGAGSCTATLSASTATQATGSCQPTGLHAGASQTLTATYNGDSLYGGSMANGSLTVNQATASVNLGNLGPHTYDGTQKAATCGTTPSGLTTAITYNGTTTAPSQSGSYDVVCTVNDANYSGSSSGTLGISTASQGISFGPLPNKTFGDPPFSVSASASSSLAVTLSSLTTGVCTVAGNTVTLVGTGTCTLRASQGGNANYDPAPDNDQGFSVNSVSGNVGLSNLGPYPYDGSAKAASCTTTPPGLTVSLSYNGSGTAPSNVGNYPVTCSITQTGYSGSANGTLSIVKADQSITFNALADRQYGSGNFNLTATASSNLPVSYTSSTLTRCAVSGSTVTLVSVGTCTINANQAGDSNWNAAAQVTRSFNITAPPSASLPPNAATPPGLASLVNVTGSAPGLAPIWNKFQFIPLTGNADSPPSGTAPTGVTFPYGLFDFVVNGLTPGGTLVLNVTYPAALPVGTVYWKYGPTPDNSTAHWYQLPVTYSDDRRTVTLTIIDGGLGDDDLTANGTIVDQGGPAAPLGAGATESIPTLSEWGLMMLTIAMLGVVALGRRRKGVASYVMGE